MAKRHEQRMTKQGVRDLGSAGMRRKAVYVCPPCIPQSTWRFNDDGTEYEEVKCARCGRWL